MWRKLLSLGLAFWLLCAPLLASPLPEPPSSVPSGSVTLSAEEYAAVEAAIIQAQEALARSNALIKKQSQTLTVLWIFSGALVTAVTLDAIADLIKK